MGLDAVMIVIEVEQTFGIKISDAEAVGLRTPRLLSNFVVDRVQAMADEFCSTQQIFYQLRRGFRAVLPSLAGDVRLATRLDNLVQREHWPATWTAVRSVAGAPEWPMNVEWPSWRNLHDGPKTVRD